MRSLTRVDAISMVATLISIVPFWSGALLLSSDLPQHLAQAAVARDFPARNLDAFFLVDLSPRPYLGATYLLIALGADQLAGRLALTLYAVALVLAVRLLIHHAPDRDPRLVWFAPMFVTAWPVAYGFLPFVLGLPPAIAAVALARRGNLIAVALLHALALLFHPLAFLCGVVATAPVLRERPRVAIALAAAALLFFAPSPDTASSASYVDEYIQTTWRFQIKHQVLNYALAYLPGHLDTACAIPGAVALLVSAIAHPNRRKRDALDLAAAAAFALYLVAPANLALGEAKVSLLGPRLLIAAWLFAIVAGPPKLRLVFVVAPLITTSALSILLTINTKNYSDAWGPTLEQALAKIPSGARVHVERATPKSSVVHTNLLAPPELHLHAYMMLENASYDPLLFSTRHSAVQTKKDAPKIYDLTWIQTASISVRHRQ